MQTIHARLRAGDCNNAKQTASARPSTATTTLVCVCVFFVKACCNVGLFHVFPTQRSSQTIVETIAFSRPQTRYDFSESWLALLPKKTYATRRTHNIVLACSCHADLVERGVSLKCEYHINWIKHGGCFGVRNCSYICEVLN